MEANRIELRAKLLSALSDCDEDAALYFQPPESVKLEYPCVIYRVATFTTSNADNIHYKKNVTFDVTYITRSSTSKVPSRMLEEPLMSFDRYYTAENLHHYSYRYTDTLKEV